MQALIEHFGGRDEDEGMPDALMNYLNDAQNSIDQWIKEGGIQQLENTHLTEATPHKIQSLI